MKNCIDYVLVDFDGTLIEGDSTKIMFQLVSSGRVDFFYNYYFKHLKAGLTGCITGRFELLRESRRKILFKVKKKLLESDCLLNAKNKLFRNVISEIKQYEKSGAKVVVISAGYREIIEGLLSDEFKYDLLAVSIDERFAYLNNYTAKVKHFESYKVGKSRIIAAYGNTEGDIPMLQLAEKAFWVDENGGISEFSK